MLHEDMKRFFEAFPREAHPMAILASAVAALSTFYQDSRHPDDPAHVEIRTIRGSSPSCPRSRRSRTSIHRPAVHVPGQRARLRCELPAHDVRGPGRAVRRRPDVARALDVLFILHADHEQNCSTSTVRMVGSRSANLFASISAGICALWGPLHGGANQEVSRCSSRSRPRAATSRIHRDGQGQEATVRLMGFGHRVYKNYDPRAKIIKSAADKVLEKLGVNDPLLDIASGSKTSRCKDDYFIERKLYPNVDFYSGIIYRALGFPTNMFTVCSPWAACRAGSRSGREMIDDPQTRSAGRASSTPGRASATTCRWRNAPRESPVLEALPDRGACELGNGEANYIHGRDRPAESLELHLAHWFGLDDRPRRQRGRVG